MIIRALSLFALIWMTGFAWFAVDLPRPLPDQKSDSVVVLTGGAKRIDRGLEVLNEKKAERLLISGVDREVKRAELAAEYKMPELFECCIDLGFIAVDTRSNALETARWLARRKDKSVRLVTSDWHMRRARLELGRAIPEDIEIMTDAVQTHPSLEILFVEYNKFIVRRAVAFIGV